MKIILQTVCCNFEVEGEAVDLEYVLSQPWIEASYKGSERKYHVNRDNVISAYVVEE